MNDMHPALWLVAAAIYFLCPLDLDFIPLIGWVDDVFVAYHCIKRWRLATEAEAARAKQSQAENEIVVELIPE